MNDSNNDNDNNAIESYSVDIVKAEDISIDSASIASVEAAMEVELIADQIEAASKAQLDKLVDIEKAISGLVVSGVKNKTRNLGKPAIAKATANRKPVITKAGRIARRDKVERAVTPSKAIAPLKFTNSIATPETIKDPQSEIVNFSPVIDRAEKAEASSPVPAAQKEKSINSVTTSTSRLVAPTVIQEIQATPADDVPSAVAINKKVEEGGKRWGNQYGNSDSKDAIQQQREQNKDSDEKPKDEKVKDEKEKGFLSKIAEVVTGDGRGEEGKSALGRVALGGFYDMGAEAIEIAKDAAGYASQVGGTLRKEKTDNKEVTDKIKSDDVISGKEDKQVDIKDELDEQTALLKDIADKDFSGGGGSLLDDISAFSGGGGADKKSAKPRGRIGRAFDKLKSKSPKLAKASGFVGSGIDKIKGLFGRGAATAATTGATTGATSAASTGSKVLAGAGNVLSKIAAPLAAVTAGYSKYQELKEREDLSDNQKNTITASTAVGAGGGALAGAAAGATIGSIVPVVGTLIGGLIGGALGAWAGGEGGSMAGEAISSVMESPLESAKVQTDAEKELANPFGSASEASQGNSSASAAKNSISESKSSASIAESTVSTPLSIDSGAADLASVESSDLSVPVMSAISNNKVEQVESLAPKTTGKPANKVKADQAPFVVKNDPALVNEMKLMNKNLSKGNNPVKRERNKSVVPYHIPKSFENHSLRLIAMDIR